MLRMIGSSACEGQWSKDLDRACYRAARQLHVHLSSDEMNVMEELYSRVTTGRNEDDIIAVVTYWFELQSYREVYISRNQSLTNVNRDVTKNPVLEEDDVRWIRNEYIWWTLWYEQTSEQQQRKESTNKLSSRMNALMNKKTAWVNAVNGVIKYGLPKIQQSTDDTTECINAIGVFAQDLATWLQFFARGLNEYRNTDDYARARESSKRPTAAPQ